MTSTTEGKHFIPFRKADVVTMCLGDSQLSEAQRDGFSRLSQILGALFHFEFHERLETLQHIYAPVNPDRDTRPCPMPSGAHTGESLVGHLTEVLNAANYVAITEADLRQALLEESLFEVRLEVNFDDFEELVFFRRGESRKSATLKKWFGLKSREIEFTNFDRVLVFARFKDADHFHNQNRKDIVFTPGSTVLKLFQNVPKADLEMLFPNTEVRMRLMDKLLIGVPAAAGSIGMIVTKLGGTLLLVGSFVAFWLGFRDQAVTIDQPALIALAVGLGGLGGYLFRQFNKFKNRKIRFMKALTDTLYFRNLDNNAGVFSRLIHDAEQEECKEALLGFFGLMRADEPLTEAQLDQWLEEWFRERWNIELDFDVADALAKLKRLGLVEAVDEGEHYRTIDLPEALRRLDERWNGVFDFSEERPVG